MKYLIIILLVFGFLKSDGQTDTVKIIALVSDTSDKHILTTDYNTFIQACDSCPIAYKQNDETYKNRNTYWINAYEVRSITYQDEKRIFFTHHIEYLDADKRPLSKSIIIWQKR